MSSVYLHQLNLKASGQEFSLTLPVAFSLVRGLNGNGQELAPLTCTPEFHVVGGPLGLPYHADLGRAGYPCTVAFSQPVGAVFVATYSPSPPAGAVFAARAVVGSYYGLQGSGNAVTAVSLALGGANYVRVSWPDGQPLGQYQFDYPLGYVWRGATSLKAGYKLLEDGVQPL